MVREGQAGRLIDMVVVDATGDWVGTVSEVYLDQQTGEPAWVTVRIGWFGHGSFVPLIGVDISGIRIRARYDKATINAAPRHDRCKILTPAEQDALYAYYGLSTGDASALGTVPTEGVTVGQVLAPRIRRYSGADDPENIALVLHTERADGAEVLTVERIPLDAGVIERNLTGAEGLDDGGDPDDGDTFVRSVN